VVVSVHNYRGFVESCLESILASTDVHPEVIVIDDASTDDSPERTRAFMEAHPELPLAHVVLPANRGLSAARNRGFQIARSGFVFVLDVDNLLYPTALARLHEALLAADAGFAYGAIGRSAIGASCSAPIRGTWPALFGELHRRHVDGPLTTWQRVMAMSKAPMPMPYGWED
jgi:glycosyltransferase involved in cell wall biosynthesis